ncbi:hypothetical protein O3M35_004160 [Rhynocoris fuscipes]|uniref:Uncharacterized protein n=1 Tax=Rhynocoris fuscipes TaxID=488301 RepID=A0AAW1CFA0_9HEMI
MNYHYMEPRRRNRSVLWVLVAPQAPGWGGQRVYRAQTRPPNRALSRTNYKHYFNQLIINSL